MTSIDNTVALGIASAAITSASAAMGSAAASLKSAATVLIHTAPVPKVLPAELLKLCGLEESPAKVLMLDDQNIGHNAPLLLVKKLSENAMVPSRASALSAGYDLFSAVDAKVPARGMALVSTDLSIVIPEGTYARIVPRSGLAWRHSIDVSTGVIDADYHGPVEVLLHNYSDVDYDVKAGDRVAQLVLERVLTPDVLEADDLDAAIRVAGGFGSTGF